MSPRLEPTRGDSWDHGSLVLPITVRTELPATLLDRLARELGGRRMLQDVIQWAFSQNRPSDVAEVVEQDEYSHDVVIPWRGQYLVFDTT